MSSYTFALPFYSQQSCDFLKILFGINAEFNIVAKGHMMLVPMLMLLLQGWEEMVDTALTHQLRTKLSKTAKDMSVNSDMVTISGDTTKLKKHIAIFIERLSKGAKLTRADAAADDFDIGT